jgi:hypothetical protein
VGKKKITEFFLFCEIDGTGMKSDNPFDMGILKEKKHNYLEITLPR